MAVVVVAVAVVVVVVVVVEDENIYIERGASEKRRKEGRKIEGELVVRVTARGCAGVRVWMYPSMHTHTRILSACSRLWRCPSLHSTLHSIPSPESSPWLSLTCTAL